MFKEHDFIIWGTSCECGNNVSILQNKHHPWLDKDFKIKLKCENCKKKISIDYQKAAKYYNDKVLSFFSDVKGTVIDLGCGNGFLTSYLNKIPQINKIFAIDIDKNVQNSIQNIDKNKQKIEFLKISADELKNYFKSNEVDFLVSRDVFMFIEKPNEFLNQVTNILRKGIRQMGWFIKENKRMKNIMNPDSIRKTLLEKNWLVEQYNLDWYKSGYFIKADKKRKQNE